MIEMLLEQPLPYQKARLENKLPAWSVGSLSQWIHTEALIQFVQDFCENEISEQKLDELKERIDNIIPLNPFTKHMSSRIFPQMMPAPSSESFRKKWPGSNQGLFGIQIQKNSNIKYSDYLKILLTAMGRPGLSTPRLNPQQNMKEA